MPRESSACCGVNLAFAGLGVWWLFFLFSANLDAWARYGAGGPWHSLASTLHPDTWPRFSVVVRSLLRYRIGVVVAVGSVVGVFFAFEVEGGVDE